MGKQFKKPFPEPEERPRLAPPPAIAEQKTVVAPAVNLPAAGEMPPQGFVQGQQGQYSSRPSGQLFPGPGGPVIPPLFPGQPRPQGNPQGQRSTGQLFGDQQAGMPANTLFGGMRNPAPTPMSGPGPSFGTPHTGNLGMPFGAPGMGNLNTPRPAWSRTGQLQGRPESIRKGEKDQGKGGKKKRRVPIWARVVIGVLLFFCVLIGGGFTYYQVYFSNSINSMTNKQFVRPKGDADPNQGLSQNVLAWKQRVNILLLGSDTDDKEGVWTGNKFLAQTVIVASIDTSTHDVAMLSIPRDFYLIIPGHGMDKLDTAFAYGGSINNDMSGVTEVVLTLEKDFGIKINFYAWVGLQGFIKVINTVDGVDVNVMHPIVDDTYPDDMTSNGTGKSGFGYRRVYIGDGPQHLDGATALEYVRSRHSTSDFDRSARQQQVLSSLRLKLENVSIISQLPQIAQDLKGSLYTSLNPTQLLELGNFARGIDASKIRHLTLSAPKYAHDSTVSIFGQMSDVVIPDCGVIPGTINTFLHMTTAICNVADNPNGQTPLLTSSPGSSSGSMADTSAIANTSMSETGGPQAVWPAPSNLFGLRDLLDLMSMVVLDSPQA